jgi:hypothetical protein
MFAPGSRYETLVTYEVKLADGRVVTAVRLRIASTGPLLGYHRRLTGQRLDHIASYYLKDATAFWRLCDANDSMSPDSLVAHDLVGIPRKGQ